MQTGKCCKLQKGHNYMHIKQGSFQGLILDVSGLNVGKRHVSKWLHHYVSNNSAECHDLAGDVKLDTALHQSFRFFSGHGYFQHTGAEDLGHLNLRYHFYLFYHNVSSQNSILFAYIWIASIA